jgi:hypothetical protein
VTARGRVGTYTVGLAELVEPDAETVEAVGVVVVG